MITSFRLRIALFSLLLTGIALIAFSGFSWWKIHDAKMNKVDSQLNDMLIGLTHNVMIGRNIIEKNKISHLLTDGDENAVLVIALDNNQITYNPSNFSDQQIAALPWPTTSERNHDFTMPPHGENGPPPEGPPPKTTFIDVELNHHTWHVGFSVTPRTRLAIGIDKALINNDMSLITTTFMIAIPLTLLLIGLAAWILSTRALQPIHTLTKTISSLSTKELHERVAITASDKEFSQLITVFNELLARLERSFQQATRFSGDAAHELKTPLTIIQGQLESSINEAEAGSVIQEKLSHTLDEVRRLSSISQKLLLLSLADAGKLRLHREPFALSQTLNDIAEDAQMLAPLLTINTNIASNITFNADAVLLRQAFQNLITNAIKYNIENGWIVITTKQTARDIMIEIKNSSSGLSTDAAKNLFERFYRGDASHNRGIEGFGLGLSLAQEIIKAHGGSLTLSTNKDNETGFLISLPMSV